MFQVTYYFGTGGGKKLNSDQTEQQKNAPAEQRADAACIPSVYDRAQSWPGPALARPRCPLIGSAAWTAGRLLAAARTAARTGLGEVMIAGRGAYAHAARRAAHAA